MPKKTFLNGYPLPASDLNTYLMDQSVMTFASATARTSALPAPTEGMTTYLEDLNQVQVYNGTSWEGLVTTTNVGTLAPQGNAVINGGFDIWQRGTSFTANPTYTADRWFSIYDGSGSTRAITQQTHTPGSAPVSGEESQYFLRYSQSVAGTGGTYSAFTTRIEDVRTFAGKTVTLSFYAKAASTLTFLQAPILDQVFGSGGSAHVETPITVSSIGTSWVRYSYSVTLPSIAGKTIGSGSYLAITFYMPTNTTFTLDIDNVQLEAGSVATPFKRNAPSLQAELAACQRYYRKVLFTDGNQIAVGQALSATLVYGKVIDFEPMRATPTASVTGSFKVFNATGGAFLASSAAIISANINNAFFTGLTVATGLVAGNAVTIFSNASNCAIELGAEL